jgi:hypothetical protein
MVPDDFPLKEAMALTNARGGSVIISPTGRYLAGPVFDEETILYADINLKKILEVKARIDTAGHYARWDVTRLLVNPEHYEPFVVPSGSETLQRAFSHPSEGMIADQLAHTVHEVKEGV